MLILFMIFPVFNAGAQNSGSTATTPAVNTPATNTPAAFEFPQWAKDTRRFEIVAFGSIPFTMLLSTTIIDMKRWYDANGMELSNEGMRYAPWPLKSAGAVAMTNKEQENTLWLAAGLSLGIAVIDVIIVQIKRNKARQRAESLPAGTIIITRTPWQEESAEIPPEEILPDDAASDNTGSALP